MSLFHSILANLQDKIETKQSEQDSIAAICTSVLQTTIMRDQVKLREGKLTIATPALVKLTIKLKQKELIQALNEKGIMVHTIG